MYLLVSVIIIITYLFNYYATRTQLLIPALLNIFLKIVQRILNKKFKQGIIIVS